VFRDTTVDVSDLAFGSSESPERSAKVVGSVAPLAIVIVVDTARDAALWSETEPMGAEVDPVDNAALPAAEAPHHSEKVFHVDRRFPAELG
jgi:hypothetical protein